MERARILRTVPAVLAVLLVAACTRTTIPGLAVHTGPAVGAPVVGDIPKTDTFVRVECWSRGEAVFGDTVWYRIGSPLEGWVTNYYVRTSGDYANRPPC